MIKRSLVALALVCFVFSIYGCGGGGGGGGGKPSVAESDYTVSFGAEANTQTVKKGTLLKLPLPEPSSDELVFGGWEDEDGGIFVGYYKVNKDITFSSKWLGSDDEKFTIKIQGSETEDATLVAADGAYLDLPDNLEKDHHTFSGWHDGNSIVTLPFQISNNVTFTANFIPILYIINFDSNGGSYIEPIKKTYGEVFELPKPTRNDYTFVEWRQNGVGVTQSYKVVGNVTLKAEWVFGEPTEYNVVFKKDGADIKSETQTLETLIELPTTIEVDGGQVEVRAWKRSSDSKVYSGYYRVNENVTFEAVETGQKYQVTINLDGGVSKETFNTTFNMLENSYTDLPVVTREHYTFTGWNDGNSAVTSPYKINDDVTLTATWEPIPYTLTFKVDEQTVGTYEGHGALTDLSSIAVPNKDGYTFVFWNSQNDGKGDMIKKGTLLTKNMDVYGIYCKNITSMSEITDLSGNYILTTPIDGETIMGIGTGNNPFSGIFGGGEFNNITIVKNPNHNGIGLFSRTKDAVIANITINNGTVNASIYDAGSIVGIAVEGTKIINCHFNGVINIESQIGRVGGIVGSLHNDTVLSECSSSGSLLGGSNGYLGGIAGAISGGVNKTIIERTFTTMDVSGREYIGGFAGSISGHNIVVSDCYAAGKVSSGYGTVGGFTSVLSSSVIERSYASGVVEAVSGSFGQVGGIVGRADGSTLKNVFALNPRVYDAKANTTVGRVIGNYFNETITVENAKALEGMDLSTNAHADGETITSAEATAKATYEALGWDFEKVWYMYDGYPKLLPPTSVE